MENIYNIIQDACLKFKSKIAFTDEKGCSINYTNFLAELNQANNYFSKINLNPCNFSIIANNSVNYLYILLSLIKKGFVASNLNPNLSNNEIKERLNFANVSILFTTEHIYSNLKDIIAETSLSLVFLIDENNLNFNVIKTISLNKPTLSNNNKYSFLQFTGGTTGVMKAACISQDNIISNLEQIKKHFENYNKLKSYNLLISFPFYHIFSLVFNFLFFFINGSTFVVYRNLRDFNLIIDLINTNNTSFIVGVNTWYKKLMQHQNFKNINLKNVELCFAGGEYVPVDTKEKWKALSNLELYSAYGLTETSSLCIISPLNSTNDNNSIGIAIPNTQAALLNEENEFINAENIVGELVLKGNHITIAYYNNISETKLAFHKTWFKTGDLAIRFNNNLYRIVDRKKDMISVSGNKVYPNEVETVITELDGIIDVAVVGRKNEQTGEEVVACVVIDKEKITPNTIQTKCKDDLTRFKVPKEIIIFDELPKTPIGKTARKILRDIVNGN